MEDSIISSVGLLSHTTPLFSISIQPTTKAMVFSSKALLAQSILLCSSILSVSASSNNPHSRPRSFNSAASHHLSLRQDVNLLDPNSYLASNFQNGSTPPGARTQDTPGQYIVMGDDQNGADAASQLPHCNTVFIGTAAVTGE